jgi:hypothetical protein
MDVLVTSQQLPTPLEQDEPACTSSHIQLKHHQPAPVKDTAEQTDGSQDTTTADDVLVQFRDRSVPEWKKLQLELNDNFVCPLTLSLMEDPYVAEDGRTYEQSAIQEHLSRSALSPFTRQHMSKTLVPNIVVRAMIDDAMNAMVRLSAGEASTPQVSAELAAFLKKTDFEEFAAQIVCSFDVHSVDDLQDVLEEDLVVDVGMNKIAARRFLRHIAEATEVAAAL